MSLRILALCLCAILSTVIPVTAQTPLGSAFTYQGNLKQNGSPVGGSANMEFRLFDVPTGGAPLGLQVEPVLPLTNGLFTVQLDFGAFAFDGNKRWLEITVNATTLSPRQELTAAPYARHAAFSAKPWITSPNGIYYNDFNAAIGTSTVFPARRFESNASATNAIAVYAENNTPAGGLATLFATNAGGGESGRFQDGNVIVANGRVGIGTGAPAAKLDVAGTAGIDGIRFPDGTLQTTAASGSGTAGKLVSSGEFSGILPSSINIPGTTWQFVGPTTNVTITAGQRLQVNGSAAIGISGTSTTFNIDVGYQLQPAGTVTTFSGGLNYMIVRIVNGSRNTWAVTGHGTGLPAGTYKIGIVVSQTGAALNDNDYANVTYMVFNAP